ncbi:hypothetical protein D3C71_1300470 [compost metagenome]
MKHSAIGMAITLLSAKPLLFEDNRLTINTADTIVKGTECLRIPKNRGIRLMPAADTAYNRTLEACLLNISIVKDSGTMSYIRSKSMTIPSRNTLDNSTVIKVNRKTMLSLATMIRLRLIGYTNIRLIVLFLYSSIIILAIIVDA